MNTTKGKVSYSLEDFPFLSAGHIHVWNVSTNPTDGLLERCRDALSEMELKRVPFFKFEDVRQNYIISQGILRILLGAYLNITPRDLKIGRHSKGKPFSLDDPKLCFNISNSGGLAVYGFSREGEIGIDIEHQRPLPDLEQMITKNFTSSEIKFINAKPAEKSQRFFRFWTVKESYLKAIGEGMRLPPDCLEFSIEESKIRLLSVKGVFEQEDWHFEEFSPAKNYVGTLTTMRPDLTVEQMDVSILF
ncbi:MAG: 4'-phosphopantetheinyl transferase superfamily protein [Flavobacteriales bacterium]|nr:4'-phosphopantetheinyl transferase superfamily protein [Flavobacteriales bacterium]